MPRAGFIRWSKTDPDIDLTSNFKRSEFRCRGRYPECEFCSKQRVSVRLIHMLQDLRDRIREPVVINSGYRCPEHNKNVRGSIRSRHMDGLAVDIAAGTNLTTSDLAVIARDEIGFRRIGVYETWVHLDVDESNIYYWYGKGIPKLPDPPR